MLKKKKNVKSLFMWKNADNELNIFSVSTQSIQENADNRMFFCRQLIAYWSGFKN